MNIFIDVHKHVGWDAIRENINPRRGFHFIAFFTFLLVVLLFEISTVVDQ